MVPMPIQESQLLEMLFYWLFEDFYVVPPLTFIYSSILSIRLD